MLRLRPRLRLRGFDLSLHYRFSSNQLAVPDLRASLLRVAHFTPAGRGPSFTSSDTLPGGPSRESDRGSVDSYDDNGRNIFKKSLTALQLCFVSTFNKMQILPSAYLTYENPFAPPNAENCTNDPNPERPVKSQATIPSLLLDGLRPRNWHLSSAS